MISHSHYTSAAALLQVHCILDAGCRKKEKIKVQQDKLAKSNPFQRVFPEAHPFLAQVFSLSSLLEHSSNCSIGLSSGRERPVASPSAPIFGNFVSKCLYRDTSQ